MTGTADRILALVVDFLDRAARVLRNEDGEDAVAYGTELPGELVASLEVRRNGGDWQRNLVVTMSRQNADWILEARITDDEHLTVREVVGDAVVPDHAVADRASAISRWGVEALKREIVTSADVVVDREIHAMDDLSEAQRERLRRSQILLGPDHPETLCEENDLALILRLVRCYDEARNLQEHVLAVRREHLGSEHPYTMAAMNGLGLILLDKGDRQAARDILTEYEAWCLAQYGPNSVEALMAHQNVERATS